MHWRRRSPERRAADAATPADNDNLERLIDEAMLIIGSALRLSAKNHLILSAMRDDVTYDEEQLVASTRTDVEALIAEKQASVTRLKRQRTRAEKRSGRASHPADYRRADASALTTRMRVDRAVADRLTAFLSDESYLSAIVSAARESALDDVLHPRLNVASSIASDPYYEEKRDQRLALLAQDLDSLAVSAAAARRTRSWFAAPPE